MSFHDFITSRLVQTCVYWANPHDNGYGKMLYDEPVEIPCRWEEKIQILGTITGAQVVGYGEVSRAVVFLNQDVDEQGCLFLGTLDDLEAQGDSDGDSSGAWYDPQQIAGAYVIKRFEKSPAIGSTTVFLRKAYLTPWLS